MKNHNLNHHCQKQNCEHIDNHDAHQHGNGDDTHVYANKYGRLNYFIR